MVQVTVAANLAEAEEIETMLRTAGIPCAIEQAVEHHPTGLEDAPQRVLVSEAELEAAQDAIESLSDPDEFIGDE
jgi:hypothetical protein